MIVIKSPSELQKTILEHRMAGKTVGVVPTMGALHEGHLSLVRQAREECVIVVVTIFVNPTQFGPSEDLQKYPRTLETDLLKCEEELVDIVFTPTAEDIYPEGFQTYVEPGPLAGVLCGASRPGHFRGVATIVLKLLNLTQPTHAYFGQKDYQQLKIIERMVRDLDIPVQIVPVPTLREPDGLAMSSRNEYLSTKERHAAVVLVRSLNMAEQTWIKGERDSQILKKSVQDFIESEPLARVDYVEVVDPDALKPVEGNADRILIAVAVVFGDTRLIDNKLLK